MKNGNRKNNYSEAYKKYYTSGSEAYRLKERPDKKSSNKSKANNGKDQTPNARQVANSRKELNRKIVLNNIKLIMCVLVVFTCSIIIMLSFTSKFYIESQITQLNSELKTVEEANLTLKTQISEQMDVKTIEELATTRLNMAKPEKHQIVYIDVKKPSYSLVVKHNEVEAVKDDFSLIDFLKMSLKSDE